MNRRNYDKAKKYKWHVQKYKDDSKILVNEFNDQIVEVIIDGRPQPRMLHCSTKGAYFMLKGKRIYAYEYDSYGNLVFIH